MKLNILITWKSKKYTAIFFIIEEARETVLDS